MPNLFMVDLKSTQLSAIEAEIIKHPAVGGIILFTQNFINKDQLKQLTATIRGIRPDIFIAVDHEGGAVQRFQKHGFFPAPALTHYGEVYSDNAEAGLTMIARNSARIAAELQECGVDLNFAPVLDLHHPDSTIIGQLGRAFHSNPQVVTQLAKAFIDVMHKADMPSVAKHFPGHGRCLGSDSDSHTALPVNAAPLETLLELDIKPFSELIKANKVDAIMAAHVLYPAVDAVNPAGYSKQWLQTILREQLGFKGLVMSDCLSMKGADIGDMPTRVQRSLDAGCDMLILCQQDRQVLLDLLNTHNFAQSPDSIDRIAAFKHSMHRFNRSAETVL
jgi:beta-N-acetylhexosaminidase